MRQGGLYRRETPDAEAELVHRTLPAGHREAPPAVVVVEPVDPPPAEATVETTPEPSRRSRKEA